MPATTALTIWAYGILFYFISFVLVTNAAMSLPCQKCHHLPPTHSLYHPAPPASFKWPKKCTGHVVWAYGNFIQIFFMLINFFLQMPPCHYHTNDAATHRTLTPIYFSFFAFIFLFIFCSLFFILIVLLPCPSCFAWGRFYLSYFILTDMYLFMTNMYIFKTDIYLFKRHVFI